MPEIKCFERREDCTVGTKVRSFRGDYLGEVTSVGGGRLGNKVTVQHPDAKGPWEAHEFYWHCLAPMPQENAQGERERYLEAWARAYHQEDAQ